MCCEECTLDFGGGAGGSGNSNLPYQILRLGEDCKMSLGSRS